MSYALIKNDKIMFSTTVVATLQRYYLDLNNLIFDDGMFVPLTPIGYALIDDFSIVKNIWDVTGNNTKIDYGFSCGESVGFYLKDNKVYTVIHFISNEKSIFVKMIIQRPKDKIIILDSSNFKRNTIIASVDLCETLTEAYRLITSLIHFSNKDFKVYSLPRLFKFIEDKKSK